MRKVGVQAHPAAVATLEKTKYCVHRLGTWNAVEAEISLAAKEDGCIAHVDSNILQLTRPEVVYLSCHESARRNRCLGRRADAKGRWESGERPELRQGIPRTQHLQAPLIWPIYSAQ